MASSIIIHFFLLQLSLFSLSSLLASSQPHSFILPIKKDPSTNLFYTSLGIGTPRTNFNLVIDLGGENLWYDCDTHYNSSSYTPIQCGSKQCPEIGCIGCDGPFKPGPVSVEGVASNEYFIDVKAVKIDGNVLNLKPSLLSLNKKGNGGTKISTITPFTELHTSVYKPFIRDFLKKASDRKLKRVKSVAPFEACFDSTSIGNSVPRIDLVLQKGVQWTIHETNLMVNVKKNVACLGIVDGGTESRMSFTKPSILIGGHQLVDNLLVFDLSSSKLSFSSSLLVHNASCS
ncbi:unnamed protein product [Vicia faba]|uniref:Peptidase A1 domain-containing protein n=1 Tax=Vicia faba TaxID=3906 RepID=A0AAV0Z2W3_VICFA|nr:unnamed protein product [Vicia faba]